MRKKVLELLIVVASFGLCLSCPNSCICKWKTGKQTVECVDKSLLIIPDGMDPGTQVLEFSGNNLRALHNDKFLKMDLINLQRIYLARCQIASVAERTFKGLTNLVELDLSGNALETIPSLLDCPSLMRLTLNANPIKIVKQDAFGHLFFLNTLELSHCEIAKVEAGAFNGLHSLEWLRLDGNQLTTLLGAKTLPPNLRGVELQANNWHCDCHMLELRAWLETFPISQTNEPVCSGPAKLSKRSVKSIPMTELACLPDVSPTSFYLEIGEGKNVSLQCEIRAVPEAHVSWWFQGQLLQNDTIVGPETRLLYYVEEGGENKRSELFIFNTNSEDNGTFICNAENPAGSVQSNFTIRIVLRAEPGFEYPVLPFEFVLIIVSATGVSLVVICFALILSIIKCHSERKRRKERCGNLVTSNSTKDSLLQESVDEFSDLSKESSNATLVDGQQMILYSTQTSEEILRSMSPILAANPALSCYQLEQNPDLINDTESLGRRREGDGTDKQASKTENAFLPVAETNRDLYRLSADVHLNPVGLLNPNSTSSRTLFNCYRTLPYNRGAKRQTQNRYRDAEFLTHAVAGPAPYEHYGPDVRYTADGYPARSNSDEQETQFSDTESLRSCCSAPAGPWPQISAAAASLAQPHHHPVSILKNASVEDKKIAVAQTQTDITSLPPKPPNRTVCGAIKIAETLTESPDEGYEGEETHTKV